MEFRRKQLQERGGNNHGSELNTTSTSIDEVVAGISSLTKEVLELMIIQILKKNMWPIFEPLISQVVRHVVREEISSQVSLMTSMNGNSGNEASPSVPSSLPVPQSLQLEFRNKISLPVLTGVEIVGENQTPIEIALVDSLSGQIVNSGAESTAEVELIVVQESSDDGKVKIGGGRKGKKILQGNTYLTLKEGIGFVGKISFTHDSVWTKNGMYRLEARIVDASLRTRVGEARTEAFPVKDRRSTLYGKHHPPSLPDKVYHLEQISYKGEYYKRLKRAGINTVRDLLIILFTNPRRLEEVLELKASSKAWKDIVDHAKNCDGMFLYLDPSLEEKTGVVFDAKREPKGSIIDSQYITIDNLSQEQKLKAQNQAMSEDLKKLEAFKDEISLQNFLQPGISFNSLRSPGPRLDISQITGRPSTSSQVTDSFIDQIGTLNSSHNTRTVEFSPENVSDRGDPSHHLDIVMATPENRRVSVPLDGELTGSTWDGHPSFASLLRQESSLSDIDINDILRQIGDRNSYDPTQPSTSQVYGNEEPFYDFNPSILICSPEYPTLYDSNTYSNCTNYVHNMCAEISKESRETSIPLASPAVPLNGAQIRWKKTTKFLRFLIMITGSGTPEGVHAHKKQRC